MSSPPARPRRWVAVAPAAALVAVALCIRAPFSAVGPLLSELGDELSLSTAALAVVTALPLVCFALVSPVAPAVARRVGVHRAVLLGAVLLAAGIVVRHLGAVGLFAGTVVLTSGVALANVLIPAAARAEYRRRSAVVVGMTTASMATSASAGAGLGQPLASLGGSARAGLLLWIVPVLAAVGAIAVLARARRGTRPPESTAPASPTAILRDRVARAVTLYFGLQALSFYAMLTWLPDVLESEAGVSPVTAGVLVAVATVLGAPTALVVPPLAVRRRSQVGWVFVCAAPSAVAIVGLLVAPAAAPVLWSVLFGLGTGASFPLALTLVLQRTRDVAQTGRLSATAQSIGYLIAAAGPLGVGLLHEATGGWTAALVLLLAVLVAQATIGVAASRPRLVSASA